jgi:hypothetical protein
MFAFGKEEMNIFFALALSKAETPEEGVDNVSKLVGKALPVYQVHQDSANVCLSEPLLSSEDLVKAVALIMFHNGFKMVPVHIASISYPSCNWASIQRTVIPRELKTAFIRFSMIALKHTRM